MQRLDLKAVTSVVTDEGEFTAVISTQTVDREKDVVEPAAMVGALRKWNRPIPLAWNHQTDAESIFGSIDPQSVTEVYGEVVAAGEVDLDSKVGREAWRSFKKRTIGFSFGYLVPEGGAVKRRGGGRHIIALDVFEVTATPAPMNNDTRVLSTKAAATSDTAFRDELGDFLLQPFEPQRKSRPPVQISTFEV
jgi:HK97 family phage prohead protease